MSRRIVALCALAFSLSSLPATEHRYAEVPTRASIARVLTPSQRYRLARYETAARGWSERPAGWRLARS